MEQRRAEEVATGKKKRGRKPKVVESLPTEEAKANTTDPDSRIMKTQRPAPLPCTRFCVVMFSSGLAPGRRWVMESRLFTLSGATKSRDSGAHCYQGSSQKYNSHSCTNY